MPRSRHQPSPRSPNGTGVATRVRAAKRCVDALRRLGVMLSCAAALVALCVGCTQPMRVMTQGDIDVRGKFDGNAAVKAELMPTPKLLPVAAMTLPYRRHNADGATVAVVDVDGLLLNSDATGLGSWGENPVSVFRERLDAIECNQHVCAVVLRINTPGGSVTATDIMWRDLMAFKKRTCLPVVACLMDVGAGGGYYLATGADVIVAHPTTVTGGIGCILNVYNLQDMMAQFNILGVPIKAGNNIDLGSPIKALGDEKRQLLQSMADEFHERFKTIVLKSRPKVDGDLKSTFDGRVFTAQQARDLGLIDRIGYFDDAVGEARARGGGCDAAVVFFHRKGDPALSNYSITANVPLQKGIIPINIPGLDRSKLPCFLYLWQMDPTLEAVQGK